MSLEKIKRNERLQGVFDRVATSYESIGPNYFSYFGKKLVEYTQVHKGSKLLDVACGKGASLFPAVCNVGESGQVIGIDFSKQMVNETEQIVREQGIKNVKITQMDAEELDFYDLSFDYVLCGLSIAFFSDSLLALNEMYRVIKKGGKIGLSTWKKKDNKGMLDKVYHKLFPESQSRNLNHIPGRPDFGTVDGIKKVLNNIGFNHIEIIVEKETFYYNNEEEWWQEQWTNASRGLFEYLDRINRLEEFKKLVFIELLDHKDNKGIRFNAEVIYSSGYKS